MYSGYPYKCYCFRHYSSCFSYSERNIARLVRKSSQKTRLVSNLLHGKNSRRSLVINMWKRSVDIFELLKRQQWTVLNVDTGTEKKIENCILSCLDVYGYNSNANIIKTG